MGFSIDFCNVITYGAIMQFRSACLPQKTNRLLSRHLQPASRRSCLGVLALAGALLLPWGAATAAPAKGGAANLAMICEPPGLDPMVSTSDLVGTIMQHVYETLY